MSTMSVSDNRHDDENPSDSRLKERSTLSSPSRRTMLFVVCPLVAFTLWCLNAKNINTLSPIQTTVSVQRAVPSSNHSCHTTECGEDITFGKAVSRLNWTAFDDIRKTNDEDRLMRFARQVYFIGFQFATMEPKKPIDSSCKAPALATPPPPDQCSSRTSNVFNGKVRANPRKVGHAIQLGFDIDTLEILLRELVDVVDKIFIIEWTMAHNRLMNPKPLAWDAVKTQDRFAFALEKVVHFVMDDIDKAFTDPSKTNSSNLAHSKKIFAAESLQELRRWERIIQWNGLTEFFGDDDLIGFGDTDEIPSRQNVHLLKHCEWTNDKPVDVGIWFPIGRINQAFRTDFPVRGHPYSLGDPTYHVFRTTLNGKVSRNRGRSPNSIVGGAHFTHYGYLIYQLMKGLSCSECGNSNRRYLQELRETVKKGDWSDYEQRRGEMHPNWKLRTIPIDRLPEDERNRLVYLPWFYDCNRDRYPMWEGRPDSRVQ